MPGTTRMTPGDEGDTEDAVEDAVNDKDDLAGRERTPEMTKKPGKLVIGKVAKTGRGGGGYNSKTRL